MSELDTGPMWLDCGGVLTPGWCHVTEDGDHVRMTLMTDPDDIAFWFPDPPPYGRTTT